MIFFMNSQRSTMLEHREPSQKVKTRPTRFLHASILGKVMISSVLDEFHTTNYAGDKLASEDQLIIWLILTHIHTTPVT